MGSIEGRREKKKKKIPSLFLSPVLLGRGLGDEAEGLVAAPRFPLLGEAAEGEGGHLGVKMKEEGKEREEERKKSKEERRAID